MDRPAFEPAMLVLASGNAGKLREFETLLNPLGFQVRPQSDWQTPEAEETGLTFIENALLKARNAAKYCGLPAIADDSGLVVPALGGAPGIFSARYAGSAADDAANNTKLLAEMNGLDGDERQAYFYCALAMLGSQDDPAPLIASARWPGRIARAPSGEGGFGYDPLFQVPSKDCTSAQLDPQTKNQLSHRGQALRQLIRQLEHRGPDAS